MAVGNKYRLKIKRGAGAPSFTLDAGQLYLDTTNKTLYWGDGTTNYLLETRIGGYPAGTKVYRALLTQSGTSAPVATVLQNTFGATVVPSYSIQGGYLFTLTGAFLTGKAFSMVNAGVSGAPGVAKSMRNNDDSILIYTYNFSGSLVNDQLTNASFEILVFP